MPMVGHIGSNAVGASSTGLPCWHYGLSRMRPMMMASWIWHGTAPWIRPVPPGVRSASAVATAELGSSTRLTPLSVLMGSGISSWLASRMPPCSKINWARSISSAAPCSGCRPLAAKSWSSWSRDGMSPMERCSVVTSLCSGSAAAYGALSSSTTGPTSLAVRPAAGYSARRRTSPCYNPGGEEVSSPIPSRRSATFVPTPKRSSSRSTWMTP